MKGLSTINSPTINFYLVRACAGACAAAYERETVSSALAHCLWLPGSAGTQGRDVLAFRGTERLHDWITDLDLSWADTGLGMVHEGFWRAAQSIVETVWLHYPPPPPAGIPGPMILTGHSLGGALAVLVGWLLARKGYPVAAVVTFGQPRVGDAQWAGSYEGTRTSNIQLPTSNIEQPISNCQGGRLGAVTWRVVHEEDIVARMPSWCCGWRHVGQEVYLPSVGRPMANPGAWRKVWPDLVGLVRQWRAGPAELVRDHPIARYVEHLADVDVKRET